MGRQSRFHMEQIVKILREYETSGLPVSIEEDFAEGRYWRGSPIEPGAGRASEIRRVFLEAMEGEGTLWPKDTHG